MKYRWAGVVLAVLIGTARGEIVDLGGGQYQAIIQSDTSQMGPNWNKSVVTYVSDSTPDTLDTYYSYTGRYDNLFFGDYERYRNWHEFSLWEIPDEAIVDSVKLVLSGFNLTGDSISIDVVNLNNIQPSSQVPQQLWNRIGTDTVYVNDTKIYSSSFKPRWRLPGAENTIQSRLGTGDEWFATGFRSNWEDRDGVLLDAYPVELWVYFRVKPQVHVERPNGGEVFYIGLEDTIQWTASDYDNYVGSADILLSRDGGTTYTLIGQAINSQHSNPWDGEYVWPVTGPESNQCKIKVIVYDTDGLQNGDESDRVFSIENVPPPQVELLWPNAPGIVVEEADTYAIRYNGDAIAGIQEVKAWFSYDSGQNWTKYIGSHPYDGPNYPTHVENHTIDWPVTQHPTMHGRVKVVLYDASNQTAEDVSNYDIIVKPARPTNLQAQVSSPWTSITLTWQDNSNYEDGYEIWRMGYTDTTWQFVATTGPNQTSYLDDGLEPGQGYLYKVRAFRNGGLNSASAYALLFTTPNARALFPPSLSTDQADFGGTASFNGRNLLVVHDTVWFAYADGGRIYVRYLDPQGNFSEPALVSGSLEEASSPTLTRVEDGRIVVVFQNRLPDGTSSLLSKALYYNWRTPSGWGSQPTRIVGPVEGYLGPPTAVGTPDGKLLVAWVDSTSGTWYLKYAHFALAGGIYIRLHELLGQPLSPLVRPAFLSPYLVRTGNSVYLYHHSDWRLKCSVWSGNSFSPSQSVLGDGAYSGFHATPMGSDVAVALSRLLNIHTDPHAQILYMLLDHGTTPTSVETVAAQIPLIYQDTFNFGWDIVVDTFLPHPVIATSWRNPVIAWEQIGSPQPEDSAFQDTLASAFQVSYAGIPPTYTAIRMRSGGSWISYDPSPSQHPLTLQFPALAISHRKNLLHCTAWTLWSHTLKVQQNYADPLLDKGYHVVAFSSKLLPIAATPWASPGEAAVRLFHLGQDPGTNLLLFAAMDTLWLSEAPRLTQWHPPVPIDAARSVAATLDPNTQTLWFLYPSPLPNTFLLRSYSLSLGLSDPDTLVLSTATNSLVTLPQIAVSQQDLFLCYYNLTGAPLDDSLFLVTQKNLTLSYFDPQNHILDNSEVLVTLRDSSIQETLNLSAGVLPSSPAFQAAASSLYLLETRSDQVVLHAFVNGSWHTHILSQNEGPYRSPHIAYDRKTVFFLWSQGSPGDIFYRFAYPDDPTFLSKSINLSNTPDADSKDPWLTGQRLFWAEQQADGSYAIFHTSMAKPGSPKALSQASWGSALRPQAVSYVVGGSYYQTTVYVTTWLQANPNETALLWDVYSTGPIPEQVLTLGDTLPTPYTTQREAFALYGTGKGKSADIGNALSYKLTDLDPQQAYTLGFYIYHEESTEVVERFYADGQPLKIIHSTPGTETYVEVAIPLASYREDSTIVVSVTKESGPTAILNEIYVFGTPLPDGGPMASESQAALPRSFGIQWVRPLPLKGTGQVQLAIPRVARVTLDLYDITGRRVRRFFQGTLAPGYHVLNLSPQDDQGHRLASGVYFLRLETPEAVRTRKVLWLR